MHNKKGAIFLFNQTGPDQGGNCTGTLINQIVANNELQQYFITAKHCLDGKDLNDTFNFVFNYQSRDCDNNSVPDELNVNLTNRDGRRYLHRSTVTPIDEVSITDFAILIIDVPIPPHFKVYYMGWSISLGQVLEFPYYDIHHLGGDIKKVAETYTLGTLTNVACELITVLIDAVFGLFGVSVNTQLICSYTESPYYFIPFWSNGVVEPGLSGSSILNSNYRIIGTLSRGWSSCDFPLTELFGRLNVSWNNSTALRDALNPDGGITIGTSGWEITCYENLLDLSGEYFPAGDYQPENAITLSASNNITTNGDLTIRTGADFTFEAGTRIDLNPGFDVQPGAQFDAVIIPHALL